MIAEGTKEQLKAIITDTKDIWIEVEVSRKFRCRKIKRNKRCESCSNWRVRDSSEILNAGLMI